ncbi:hypothetical protein Tco_0046308 [Tanacetum coccineum]
MPNVALLRRKILKVGFVLRIVIEWLTARPITTMMIFDIPFSVSFSSSFSSPSFSYVSFSSSFSSVSDDSRDVVSVDSFDFAGDLCGVVSVCGGCVSVCGVVSIVVRLAFDGG